MMIDDHPPMWQNKAPYFLTMATYADLSFDDKSWLNLGFTAWDANDANDANATCVVIRFAGKIIRKAAFRKSQDPSSNFPW